MPWRARPAESPQPAGRGRDIPTPQLIGRPLHPALKGDALKRPFPGISAGSTPTSRALLELRASLANTLIPLTATPSASGSGGDHLAARAHTESIHSPAAGRAAGKLIVRRAQSRMAGKAAILAAIDHLPRVLDPHPLRQRACVPSAHPCDAAFPWCPGHCARRRKSPGGKGIPPGQPACLPKAGQPASLCQDIRDPVAEQDPASQF